MSLAFESHVRLYVKLPDPAAQRLKELWLEGTRTLIIADLLNKEFGLRLSKNAVIGKAYRMHLGPHRNAVQRTLDPILLAERAARRAQRDREWRANNRDRLNANQRRYWLRLQERKSAPIIEDFSIPTPQRKTIFELGPHDCRWPVGEPRSDLFFFCGAVAEEKRPYCSSHCQRAYVAIRPR